MYLPESEESPMGFRDEGLNSQIEILSQTFRMPWYYDQKRPLSHYRLVNVIRCEQCPFAATAV